MCGISGFLDLETGVDTDVLQRMTAVIRHRGPDDEGYALIGRTGTAFYGGADTLPQLALPPLKGCPPAEAFLGLGHRRLSILDLSAAGHQPMFLPERDLVLTYNGEIYNYLELRDQLESLGYRFRTACDTEVLLYAYCQWGEDCLSHFNGMWGFALWDGREQKLFCARDRLGAKPFHYCRRGNRLLFGSELKQLCQDPAAEKRFNRQTLAANLMYRISDFNDQTLIQGMQVLPPGHKLVVRVDPEEGRITSLAAAPYWTLSVTYDHGKTEDQWAEEVAEEFSRACRWRMRSDAPLGALLSGGLDSSCMVTELCSGLSDPSRLQTFTTSYPGDPSCDERHFADLVNRACGCTGSAVTPRPAEPERLFADMIWHAEGPCGLAQMGVLLLLEEIARRGYKVILNGQCGDELMLGYERYYAYYFASLLREGHPGALLREFYLAGRHSRVGWRGQAAYALYFNFPQVRTRRQLQRAGRFVAEDLLADRDRQELRTLLDPPSLEQLQYNELTATQLPHIVRLDDRLYMSASIESRIPFMDYRFVELSCRIPPAYKIKNGYTKYLMRRVFDGRMPSQVTWRTDKMGFGAPVGTWAEQFSREYLMDQVQTAVTGAYFKKDALASMVGPHRREAALFDFLAVEQFARQYGVR